MDTAILLICAYKDSKRHKAIWSNAIQYVWIQCYLSVGRFNLGALILFFFSPRSRALKYVQMGSS